MSSIPHEVSLSTCTQSMRHAQSFVRVWPQTRCSPPPTHPTPMYTVRIYRVSNLRSCLFVFDV